MYVVQLSIEALTRRLEILAFAVFALSSDLIPGAELGRSVAANWKSGAVGSIN